MSKKEETKTEKTAIVNLPIIRGETEDEVVRVNDRRFLIKRGVKVKVPEFVARALEHKERMQLKAFEYEQSVQK